MTIRQATVADAAALTEVLVTVAAEPGGWLASDPPADVAARVERMRADLSGEDDAFWAVEDEHGRIVGLGGLHPGSARGVSSLGMALLPQARGQGAGRALLRRIVEQARAGGAHKLELEVWPDNGRALALYASEGFVVEGIRRDHHRRADGSLRSTVLMARLLTRA